VFAASLLDGGSSELHALPSFTSAVESLGKKWGGEQNHGHSFPLSVIELYHYRCIDENMDAVSFSRFVNTVYWSQIY
jgi:hypothetical protein